MYCSHCGQQADEGSRFCNHCGRPLWESRLCPNCGREPEKAARFCNHCGQSMPNQSTGEAAYSSASPTKTKVAAGVLAIVVGWLGIHKFYLGYTTQGIILVGAFIASLLLAIIIVGIFGLIAITTITLIEGILYLTKTDEEFHYTYVVNRKEWF